MRGAAIFLAITLLIPSTATAQVGHDICFDACHDWTMFYYESGMYTPEELNDFFFTCLGACRAVE